MSLCVCDIVIVILQPSWLVSVGNTLSAEWLWLFFSHRRGVCVEVCGLSLITREGVG